MVVNAGFASCEGNDLMKTIFVSAQAGDCKRLAILALVGGGQSTDNAGPFGARLPPCWPPSDGRYVDHRRPQGLPEFCGYFSAGLACHVLPGPPVQGQDQTLATSLGQPAVIGQPLVICAEFCLCLNAAERRTAATARIAASGLLRCSPA